MLVIGLARMKYAWLSMLALETRPKARSKAVVAYFADLLIWYIQPLASGAATTQFVALAFSSPPPSF